MTRRPNLLEDIERTPDTERDYPPDAVSHWSRQERWEALGKEIGDLKLAARYIGMKLEEMPGAPAKIAEFKELTRELNRGTR